MEKVELAFMKQSLLATKDWETYQSILRVYVKQVAHQRIKRKK